MTSDDIIRNFGMANILTEITLDKIEDSYDLNLGRPIKNSDFKDLNYYPQFEQNIRKEARLMARYYEIFYCLEKTIRNLVIQRLSEEAPNEDWWSKFVPQQVNDAAIKKKKNEESKGVTLRSTNLIDYTNFGELGIIISSNWEIFGDTFKNMTAFQNIMATLNLLRSPIAHSCALARDEIMRLEITISDLFRQMS